MGVLAARSTEQGRQAVHWDELGVDLRCESAGARGCGDTEVPVARGAEDYKGELGKLACRLGEQLVESGRPLLDCGLEQGVDMDYGCRVGACGACAVEVVEGLENVEEPDFIEQDALDRYELPREVRLACRACVKGPVTLRSLPE